MYQLTAADFADTGQWRLLLKIGCTGLEGWLENTFHPEIEPQPLCVAQWNINKDMLRNNIEEAVYNNPRLLDDFATRIILYDPRTLFIPSRIADESLGAEEELYKKVYTAEEIDIQSDKEGDITAVWCLAPGVKGFLMRTFPGARITCNLMEKVCQLRKENSGLSLFAEARKNEVDIIFLDGNDLLSASTHEWTHADDIAYLVLNLIEVYNKTTKDTKIVLKGSHANTEAWKHIAAKSKKFQYQSKEDENNKW